MNNKTIFKFIAFFMTAIIISCNSDDSEDIGETNKIEGRYIVMSATTESGNDDAYLSLYDEIPSGEIENVGDNTTQVNSYGRFFVIDNKWAFQKAKFTGETGLVRYSLDDTGAFVTDGFISMEAKPTYFISDETTGFYGDPSRSTLGVQTFNPSTMARTGEIDASALFTEEELNNFNIVVGYTTLVVSGGKLFANVEYTLKDGVSEELKEPHFTMVVFDIALEKAEKLITHTGEIYSQGHGAVTEYPALLVTPDGTIYMATHALLDRDDEGYMPKSAIFRINGGETDFDQDWVLTGSDMLGGGEDDRKIVWSIAYVNENLYVDCSDDSMKPDYSNLTDYMYNVYVVDTDTKEATKITGAPNSTFGFADGGFFEVNDELFFQVKNNNEGSGYYRINSDNTATNVFNITDTYPRAIGYLEIQD